MGAQSPSCEPAVAMLTQIKNGARFGVDVHMYVYRYIRLREEILVHPIFGFALKILQTSQLMKQQKIVIFAILHTKITKKHRQEPQHPPKIHGFDCFLVVFRRKLDAQVFTVNRLAQTLYKGRDR